MTHNALKDANKLYLQQKTELIQQMSRRGIYACEWREDNPITKALRTIDLARLELLDKFCAEERDGQEKIINLIEALNIVYEQYRIAIKQVMHKHGYSYEKGLEGNNICCKVLIKANAGYNKMIELLVKKIKEAE